MSRKAESLKNSISLFAYLLIVWGFYRILFQLPEEIEEVVIKPVVWLGGTYFFLRKEGGGLKDLGITGKNLFPSVYFALSLAAFFGLEGLVVNFIKYGGLNFNANLGQQAFFVAIGLSFVTAVSEEISFRGFIFNRLLVNGWGEWKANIVTSLGWILIHAPVALFVWSLAPGELGLFMLLSFVFSMGAGFVFARTGNVFSSILLHVFWQWPIILFR